MLLEFSLAMTVAKNLAAFFGTVDLKESTFFGELVFRGLGIGSALLLEIAIPVVGEGHGVRLRGCQRRTREPLVDQVLPRLATLAGSEDDEEGDGQEHDEEADGRRQEGDQHEMVASQRAGRPVELARFDGESLQLVLTQMKHRASPTKMRR